MGFAKAYKLAEIIQLTMPISKMAGIGWLAACVLIVVCAIMLLMKNDNWWMIAIIAIVLSQILIIASWQDAKFGTILNVIILIAAIVGWGNQSFKSNYLKDIKSNLVATEQIQTDLMTEADILSLPKPVIKYIQYSGFVGKPKVKNFKIIFTGNLRKNEASEWMPFESEQYNFMEMPTRLFFLKAVMKHLPVRGYHCFKNGTALMDIRLFSLFRVQYQTGKEIGISETVTFFNDMCVMAPATLIDKRIKWLDEGNNKVKAEFTNNNITISAWLYFNDKGELINFVSEDRYAVTEKNTMKRLQWFTPLKDYREINGYRLAGYAEAIYKYPEGDMCYGNFRVTNVVYNCQQ